MAEQHSATPDEWACVKEYNSEISFSCILELLHRIEALEATTPAKPNHPEIPDSSLVERVAAAIHPNVCADPNLYLHEARAAIREIAAWLRKEFPYGARGWAMRLEREAKR